MVDVNDSNGSDGPMRFQSISHLTNKKTMNVGASSVSTGGTKPPDISDCRREAADILRDLCSIEPPDGYESRAHAGVIHANLINLRPVVSEYGALAKRAANMLKRPLAPQHPAQIDAIWDAAAESAHAVEHGAD